MSLSYCACYRTVDISRRISARHITKARYENQSSNLALEKAPLGESTTQQEVKSDPFQSYNVY